MTKVYVGKIVSTHGIKGEIRILSDFPYKEKAFLVGSFLWVGSFRLEIERYRQHKNYDMITFVNYHDINEVEPFLHQNVYKEKEELNLAENEILDEDLLDFKVKTEDGQIGIIQEIFFASPQNKIMRVLLNDREVLIPLNNFFILSLNKHEKMIYVHLISGM